MVRAMVISGSILAMTDLISERTLKGLGFRCLLSFCCRILQLIYHREDSGLLEFVDLDQLESPDLHVDSVRMMSLFRKVREIIDAIGICRPRSTGCFEDV
ncbi:hypothetical protein Hanom_Chr00s000004g01609501 [Helianthus anomalus]